MHPVDAGNDKLGQSLPVSMTIQRRTWHTRKISEAEEVVKYMSSIPRYLQCEATKYNIQEKALNVGVLDWGRLQKWADHEKPVTNRKHHDSTSSTNPSSLSSAFDSSPQSSKGNTSPSTERRQFCTSDVQQASKSSSTSDSRSSAEKDRRKGRRKDSSKQIINSQLPDMCSLPSSSAGSENFALLRRNANTNVDKFDELEKVEISIEKESCRSRLYKDGDRPKQSRRKHLEEIIARSMSSFDASSLDPQTKMSRSAFTGTSLPPHSPAPSSDTNRDEPHETKKKASFESERQHPPIFLPRVDLKGITGTPSKPIHDNPNEAFASSSSRGRRSPMRQFFDQPRKSSSSVDSVSDIPDGFSGRSSSRGRPNSVKQMLDPLSNSSIPDVSGSRSTSRGRRSPLRQMFDSPQKSFSSISSSQQQPHESFSIVDPPTCKDSSSSNPKNFPSTRQALLKLSWKNGLPLIMFSSSDDSILVAKMHKGGNSDMNICDCFYEIHTAMAIEAKKKNGAWLSQGTKSKKPEFSCKFVAELIVSSSERVSFDPTHCSFIRQHVLLGDELAPTNRVDATNLSSSELAAIVVETPPQRSPSSYGIHCVPQIVAILPNDVHGLSNTREPSKLIERWESGGSCDCGGWDEGCSLTVLTNDSREMKNSKLVEDCGAIGGRSCGFDLFTEGDARKGKHSFKMVAFKEDMFTVEFKASIHLLQAFAISIAMLHDRIPCDGMMDYESVDMDKYEDLSFESYPSFSS